MRRLLARFFSHVADAATPERIANYLGRFIDYLGFIVFVYFARRVDNLYAFGACALGFEMWTRFWLAYTRSTDAR